MNHIFPFSTNECYNYTNLKTTIHVLTLKLASRHESHTKIVFFFENNAVDCTTFAGWPTESVGLIVCASFILDLPYLAHISLLWLA